MIPYWNTLVVSNDLNTPWNLTVDDGGNIYIADGYDGAIKRWNAVTGALDAPIPSGLGDPTSVAVDNTGNVYIADYGANAVKELPYAFVDPSSKNEGPDVTSDSLSPVLLNSENLLPTVCPHPGPILD